MSIYKYVLEDDLEEDGYFLIAIHCSAEPYKMAFMLNKFVALRLARKPLDISLSKDGFDASFSLFEYKDPKSLYVYNLVANKNTTKMEELYGSNSLFKSIHSEKTISSFLLDEFKEVDFFLKIQTDGEEPPLKDIISAINKIKQVITVYTIDIETIKQKNNLIFL